MAERILTDTTDSMPSKPTPDAPVGNDLVTVWKKRIDASVKLYSDWEKRCRVKEGYNYWQGEQRQNPYDQFGNRLAQVNKIHPAVKNNIPSLYYYRPYAKLRAKPELTDQAGSNIESRTQLLQDAANTLIRDKSVGFRDNTFLALKEAHWAFGLVEVGHSAEFADTGFTEDKPPKKEKPDTPTELPTAQTGEGAVPTEGPTSPEDNTTPDNSPSEGTVPPAEGSTQSEDDQIADELARLQGALKQERFFVKHIPAKQVLVSGTDMPVLEKNDWIGYWEDVPLEDVKRASGYKNLEGLKASPVEGDEQSARLMKMADDPEGDTERVRLYKIWDLRTRTKLVFAKGHKQVLQAIPYKRCPLKFLRFDVDPYHFLPRPLLLSKLDQQDEYNDSREYLRKERKGRVSRYTYDETAIKATDMQKLESGEMGTYVPRAANTSNVIEPVNQPSMGDSAMTTLTLSDKEFMDVGGIGDDSRIAATKTATQAKIAATKEQTQDSFDRLTVADWLSDIIEELLRLAIENMSIDQWIAINIPPDNTMAPMLGQQIQQQVQMINADVLSDANAGLSWEVVIDLDSLSPVSEEEELQRWMTALNLFANPILARLFSVAPPLLDRTLDLIGIKSGRDKAMVEQAMMTIVQMEQQLAAMGQNAAPGVSPQGGGPAPGAPKPGAGGPPTPPRPTPAPAAQRPGAPGGPQPGGPAGPGASRPR